MRQLTFAERLHVLRRRKGLTMRALAALVECAPSDIYRMEKGHVLTPSADRLARLAQALGVTMDVLWLGDVDESEEYAALIAELRGYQSMRRIRAAISAAPIGHHTALKQ